jgi:hypothetical protein
LKNQIIINRLFDKNEFEIVPLRRKRLWMDLTQDAFAYHCMPLGIANEYGWSVISPANFEATWNGESDVNDLQIRYYDDDNYDFAHSHFGNGVLTISVDFIIQTEEGVSTYVRGIPNETIDGLQPLDGIVETDWLPFTFTYNYKFTRPCTVIFEKDEPLFSFFPIRRGEIEAYKIRNKKIKNNKDLLYKYEEYASARDYYLDNMTNPEVKLSPQKYYNSATSPLGKRYDAINHIKKIKLSGVDE